LSADGAQVTVAWDASTDPDIAGYNIWYGTNPPYSKLSAGNSTSITISNLVEGATYTIYATAYNVEGLESNPSSSITYIVPASSPPTITGQPASQTITPDSPFTLSIAATGAGALQYQWYHNGNPIAGATASTFQITAAQVLDSGNYYATVSNSAGTTTSGSASVIVLATPITPPTIVVQPIGQTLSIGSVLNLSVQGNGGSLQYQWLHDALVIPGATSANFQIASVQMSDAGHYAVRVSNSAGTVSSTTVTVTVNLIVPPSITAQPLNQTVAGGSSVTLSAQANGSAPLAYQWFHNNVVVAGATGSALQIASAQAADAGNYYVRISNPAGAINSATVNINVLAAPGITVQPLSQTMALGSTVSFSVQAVGSGPLYYQWYHDGNIIPGAISATLQIGSAQSSDGGNYYVAISNNSGLSTSATATLSISSIVPPRITIQPESQTTSAGNAVTLTAFSLGSPPLQYQWFHNDNPVPGTTSATLEIPAAQTNDVGTYYVRISNAAGTVTSAAAIVALSTAPTISVQPVDQTNTAGSALNLSVQATGSAPLQYQWFHDGAVIAGATSPILQVLSVQLSDAGNYYVTVANSAGGATSASAAVTIQAGQTVAPSIVTQPLDQTVGGGSAFNLSVQATGSAPLQYQWFHDGARIIGETSALLQIASAQSQDVGDYYVVVSNAVGTVTSAPATIFVTGVSTLSVPSITTQPLSQTIGVGTGARLTVRASGSQLQYQWYHNGVAIPSGISSSLQISAAQYSDSGNYYVTLWNSLGSTTSASASLIVLAPVFITTQPLNQTANAGAPVTFSVQASGSGPLSFQWYHNGSPLSGPGSTTATLVISSAQANLAGVYYATVANAATKATSSEVRLNVLSGVPGVTTNNGKSGAEGGASSTAYLGLKPGQAILAPPNASGKIVIQMIGTPGTIYQVQSCDNLTTLQWLTIATVVAAEDGLIEVSLSSKTQNQFFQAIAQ